MGILKFEYLENEKSFLDEIKSIFHSFWMAIIWWKNNKLMKIADTSFKDNNEMLFLSSHRLWVTFFQNTSTHCFCKYRAKGGSCFYFFVFRGIKKYFNLRFTHLLSDRRNNQNPAKNVQNILYTRGRYHIETSQLIFNTGIESETPLVKFYS